MNYEDFIAGTRHEPTNGSKEDDIFLRILRNQVSKGAMNSVRS